VYYDLCPHYWDLGARIIKYREIRSICRYTTLFPSVFQPFKLSNSEAFVSANLKPPPGLSHEELAHKGLLSPSFAAYVENKFDSDNCYEQYKILKEVNVAS